MTAGDAEKNDATVAGGLTSSDPVQVRKWLAQHHRKQLTLLDKFLLELRLGRIGVSKSASVDAEDDEGNETMTESASLSSTSASSLAPVDRRLVVLQTVELLKYIMGPTSWKSAAELLHLVRAVGTELHTAGGMRREPAIGNVIRRIMAAIREEAQRETLSTAGDGGDLSRKAEAGAGNRLSLDSILWALPQHVRDTGSTSRSHHGDHQRQESFLLSDNNNADQQFPPIFYKHRPDLKQTVMEAVQEILSDLEDTYKNLNEQSTSHIQGGDIVLTCGRSKTTELFLKAANLKTKQRQQGPFQVIVCEGGAGSGGGGRAMATSLAQVGMETILIPDSAIFAVMSRVNKVIIPAHAVLANGGLIASSGCNVVALAAHHHSVPVVCVTGIFKLCPIFPHDGQDTLNDLISPSSVLEYSNLKDTRLSDVEFVNPVRDYIAPQYIDLYVTNVGSFQPSFIYRLLAEYYHSDDWDLFD
eukprot:CAMPEP_0172448112 /NCGR_PEP_ID=MMETSP1065-20121228/7194_1 /TAXON_ID=265537 /ORGANISM="Amphiprora paludosa, Strain CCMP125" /LENGTH=471 /DNA_ID=CAMNT_0013199515 /DNA_START=83 /DNA_END=1498 /DNA_ORIENTATION=-